MFGKKKSKSTADVARLSSLIADNVEIVGDVIFTGGLRIDGRVDGNVIGKDGANSLLVLSDKGSINGRVKVYDAVVNGNIAGDVEVEHFVELQPKASVAGNISYRQLQLECGASVDGKLQRIGDDCPEAGDTAIMDVRATARAAG